MAFHCVKKKITKPDPYVQIEYQGQKAKTQIKKATRSPRYDCTYTFEINKLNFGEVVIEIWDAKKKNPFFIGGINLSISKFRRINFDSAKPEIFTLMQNKNDRVRGYIYLQIGMIYEKANENETIEKIKEEADKVSGESLASTKRALKNVRHIERIGNKTNRLLDVQVMKLENLSTELGIEKIKEKKNKKKKVKVKEKKKKKKIIIVEEGCNNMDDMTPLSRTTQRNNNETNRNIDRIYEAMPAIKDIAVEIGQNIDKLNMKEEVLKEAVNKLNEKKRNKITQKKEKEKEKDLEDNTC